MKEGSFHTRRFRRIHLSVFRYRWSKTGFTGPKTFQGFRETGPWHSLVVGRPSMTREYQEGQCFPGWERLTWGQKSPELVRWNTKMKGKKRGKFASWSNIALIDSFTCTHYRLCVLLKQITSRHYWIEYLKSISERHKTTLWPGKLLLRSERASERAAL